MTPLLKALTRRPFISEQSSSPPSGYMPSLFLCGPTSTTWPLTLSTQPHLYFFYSYVPALLAVACVQNTLPHISTYETPSLPSNLFPSPLPNDTYSDYSLENCILHPWTPATSSSPHVVYFSFLFFHGTYHFLNRIVTS